MNDIALMISILCLIISCVFNARATRKLADAIHIIAKINDERYDHVRQSMLDRARKDFVRANNIHHIAEE